MASVGSFEAALAVFDQQAKAWTNALQSNQLFRLVVGPLHQATKAECAVPAICQTIIVQQADFQRPNFEANGIFSWGSGGIPNHSTQAETTALYGAVTMGVGPFPMHLCGPAPYPLGTVLGINLPDVHNEKGFGTACRFLKCPEWDYPDPERPHVQLCGNFDFGQIPSWSQYWLNAILTEAI